MTKAVSIESPFHSDDEKILKRNICYAILAVKDATLNHNEAPYASHLLNTQFVYYGEHCYVGDNFADNFCLGREKVIEITHTMRTKMDKIVFYIDFGYSPGMLAAKKVAEDHNIAIEERRLPPSMLQHLTSPK